MNNKCDFCNSKAVAHKDIGYLCSKHYMQYRRHGKVSTVTTRDKNRIILHNDYAELVIRNISGEEVCTTKIDLDDLDRVSSKIWSLQNKGYIAHGAPPLYLHRFIMNAEQGLDVDHINGDIKDNRKSNLRICSHACNTRNRVNTQCRNTTGITGVRVYKPNGKFIARITVDKKVIHLGYFDSLERAIEARLDAEKTYFGEYISQANIKALND